MASQIKYEKMLCRQDFSNHWHTDLSNTISEDCPFCCFACFCAPCASYVLRRRALYNDMSRYECCAGYMPCSGRCMESHCPELCLGTETQHKIEMDKRDGMFGPQEVMGVPPVQMMSRMDQPMPPAVGYPPPAVGQPYYQYPPPPGYGYPPADPNTYPPPPGYNGYPAYPPMPYPPPPADHTNVYPPPPHANPHK